MSYNGAHTAFQGLDLPLRHQWHLLNQFNEAESWLLQRSHKRCSMTVNDFSEQEDYSETKWHSNYAYMCPSAKLCLYVSFSKSRVWWQWHSMSTSILQWDYSVIEWHSNYVCKCTSVRLQCDGSDTPCLQVYFSETTVWRQWHSNYVCKCTSVRLQRDRVTLQLCLQVYFSETTVWSSDTPTMSASVLRVWPTDMQVTSTLYMCPSTTLGNQPSSALCCQHWYVQQDNQQQTVNAYHELSATNVQFSSYMKCDAYNNNNSIWSTICIMGSTIDVWLFQTRT